MNTTVSTLAIDAGQSSIRARFHHLARPAFQLDFPPLLTDQPLMPQLESVIREILLKRPAENVRVAAALSGLTPFNADPDGVLHASRDLGVTAVYLVHDSISGYLGCLGHRRGSAVAAGTGVVTLATGTSSYSRVDGWGNIMGDAGSGYWIGRAGLEAAMRAHDRRGMHTAILDLLHEGFPNLETAYMDIQSHPERIALVASYARKIIELSEHDRVSARIIERATDELALSVGASLRNTRWDAGSCPSISWVGSILSNPLMSRPLRRKLELAWPNAEILPPQGGPLDGAAIIPDLPLDHPLHPLLHVATKPT
ncbi:N-acetylglucosamine kinase [Pseudarthrobacter sp. NPDC055928]|uniref:N-acetylglucosamine kinase n=1 Tax=Pseudarthrobacter sp. NPDC055928 TaxID=3345661 RepID=UPI0035DB3F25